MYGQEKFDKLVEKYPHPHVHFSRRPDFTRRRFFEVAGAGLTASFLANRGQAAGQPVIQYPVAMKNTAKNVIFILLAGAPSHTDLFDYKQIPEQPASFAPATINGAQLPTGLLPKLSTHFQNNNLAIVRSLNSWGLVHTLNQTWTQIGRNPGGVLGNISPNIGSVVAIEKGDQKSLFPAFLALNSQNCAGPGYFSAKFAPFKVTPAAGGLRNTTNADGQTRFGTRWNLMHALDDNLRGNPTLGTASPMGTEMEDYNTFYQAASGMMYNSTVTKAFSFTTAENVAYGSTGFGQACITARKVLEANQGTRFVQITLGGWDMHVGIYTPAQMPTMGKQLDDGLGQLITDLKADGLYDSTMIVVAGEFGRTVGSLTAAAGRDHFPLQFALFAGGGVAGGRALGATDATGANVVDPGWSRQRVVRPEDIEATIYSALGINWTTIRQDDPLNRGYYYVPNSDTDLYGPINELWG
jgi:hypothetical protein